MRFIRLPLPVLAVFGLVFLAALGQAMLYPLVPALAREFELSPAQAGVLLSAATFGTLVAAVPAGLLAERIGALRVSIGAGPLLAVAAVVQALATSFPVFLGGQLLFGLACAAIWTAGVTLLANPTAKRSAVGGTVTVGGIAHLVGPPFSGVLTDAVGRALPFWLLAGAAATVTLAATATATAARAPDPGRGARPGLVAAARASASDPVLRSAAVLIALVGALTGMVPLVVPLLLDRDGFSSSEIGAVLAAGSVIWVLASGLAVRAGARAVTVGVAGTGLLLLAVVALLPVLALATPCLVAFVVLRAGIQAPLSTINYDLGAHGARNAGVAVGAAMGLLNLVWAASAATAPVIAGALVAGGGGPRSVFLLLAFGCAAAGLWMRFSRGVAGGVPAAHAGKVSRAARHGTRSRARDGSRSQRAARRSAWRSSNDPVVSSH